MKKFVLAIVAGFVGMLLAHFIILSGFGLHSPILLYPVAYPIVFLSLSFLLARHVKGWQLSHTLSLFVVPCLYWYALLINDHKFTWEDAMDFDASSAMLLILPLTVLLTVLLRRLLLFRLAP